MGHEVTGPARAGFFNRAGFSSSIYVQEELRKAAEPFTTVDEKGRATVDITAPGYFDAIGRVTEKASPDLKAGAGYANKYWEMPAAQREAAVKAYKAPGADPALDEYLDQVDSYKSIGDSQRYVTLEHGQESSGYMMELPPEGDVHRFFDLESPAGDPMMLSLPQGSYSVKGEWKSSPMIDAGIQSLKDAGGRVRTYTPPDLVVEVRVMPSGRQAEAERFQEALDRDSRALDELVDRVDAIHKQQDINETRRTGPFMQTYERMDPDGYVRRAGERATREHVPPGPGSMRDKLGWMGAIWARDDIDKAKEKAYEESHPARIPGDGGLWSSDIAGVRIETEDRDGAICSAEELARYEKQTKDARETGDSGRYVKLQRYGIESGYLMELERDGDVHRFLDLESPYGKGTPAIIELPHGSFEQVSEYEACPMFDEAIQRAKDWQNRKKCLPSFIPEGLEEQVAAKRDPSFQPGFFKTEQEAAGKSKQAGYGAEFMDAGAYGRQAVTAAKMEDLQAGGGRRFGAQDAFATGREPYMGNVKDGRRFGAQDAFATQADIQTKRGALAPGHPETRVIDGRLHRDSGDGLYHRVPISMDEARSLPIGDIDHPAAHYVDDATGRQYPVADDPVKYYNKIRDDGAVMAEMYPIDESGPYPGDRHMIQVDRDMALLGPRGEDGKPSVKALSQGDWMDMTDPKNPVGFTQAEAEDMFYDVAPRHSSPAGVTPMFINCPRGQQTPWGLSVQDACVPVQVLFNENSTVGEVRPLETTRIWNKESRDGVLIDCGENFVAGHGDLSAEPMAGFERMKDEFRYREPGQLAQPGEEAVKQAEAEGPEAP